ncbi:MAG: hypothetical protein FWD13_07620, partial [Treponema sp.]|nr:hypothetical protein [Treponema sp.]
HWKRRGIKRNGRDIPDESARRTNVRAIGANENIEPQDVRSGTSGLFIQTDTSRQTFENIKPQGITSPVGGPK